MKNKFLKKLIPVFLVILIIGTAIPLQVFAKDYEVKYHPDDWFGYTHSEAEINSWITDAVKYPTITDEAMKALTGEIRPEDIISFQVEYEMPTGHEEIFPFLRDFSLNMTFPYGAVAMIEVYASDAPLLTDEEYDEKIADFNARIDELDETLSDETIFEAIETGEISESDYIMYSDMVENRDKYLNIYKSQLETAKTKYGLIDSSYGTSETWAGSCQDNPNTNLGEDETYQSWRDNVFEQSYVAPQITSEEFEQVVSEFDAQYPLLIEEYKAFYEEVKAEYEQGNLEEADWIIIENQIASINDGTFYDTVIKYFEDCRDGYFHEENFNVVRFMDLAFSGKDYHNAYFGTYTFNFPNNLVQRNQKCTYIFDINIVATDALSVGSYVSIPSLRYFYEENCSLQYWVSEGFLKGHYEYYYPCNSQRSALLNFGNTVYSNNTDFDANDIEYKFNSDKRMIAWDYISKTFGDEDYVNKFKYEYLSEILENNTLKVIRPFTIEYRDENGNLIKSETTETSDAYYHIIPEDIYDFELVSPEHISGIIENKNTTVTIAYRHKDAQIQVKHIDSFGNEIAPTETISGKTLDEYKTEPVRINGYELVETPANASGVLHENSDNVEYTYRLKDTSVIINYIDEKRNEIAERDIINGKVFDSYETNAKEFYGYILTNNPENSFGEMTEESITVDYIYRKIFDKLPDEPYKAIYGDKLTGIELPYGWVFEDVLNNPDATVGEVGTKTFNVIVPADENHPEIKGVVTVEVSKKDWIEGIDYGKLPDEPYKAIYGDKLTGIELPYGWVFEDVLNNPDATVGEVGTKTFNVIVPADENHPEIRGVVTVEVSNVLIDNSSVENNTLNELEVIDTGDIINIARIVIMCVLLVALVLGIVLIKKNNTKKHRKSKN